MKLSHYQKALKFIFDRQLFGVKLGLENITRLAERLENPQDRFPAIHVAGSNGKGSTSSFISGILQQCGYRVGLYTSPHLADFRERIRINGRKIGPSAVVEFIEKYRRPLIECDATYFEVTTALAFWYFAREKVDWAVLETGLGGRLDATNIVTPRVAVITNISHEHTHILGRTIYRIAGEKAGIIKPGVPVVTGVVNDGNPAARGIAEVARKRGAVVHFTSRRSYEYSFDGEKDVLLIKKGPWAGLKTPLSLAGRHQADNAHVAVKAAEILGRQGVRITRKALKRALTLTYWPARFMILRRRPTLILDAAHNMAGFEALAQTLRVHFPGRRFDFLVGMVEKKRGDRCLEIIAPLAHSLTLTPLENERRDDPYFLISRLDFARVPVRLFPHALQAAKDLLENSRPSDILVIAGSHYLIGEVSPLVKRDGF